MGNVLNVSFHPSEIGKHLDLLYIRFKCGARRELTQVARAPLFIARYARESKATFIMFMFCLLDRTIQICVSCFRAVDIWSFEYNYLILTTGCSTWHLVANNSLRI